MGLLGVVLAHLCAFLLMRCDGSFLDLSSSLRACSFVIIATMVF